jgi:hypothetical protein
MALWRFLGVPGAVPMGIADEDAEILTRLRFSPKLTPMAPVKRVRVCPGERSPNTSRLLRGIAAERALRF